MVQIYNGISLSQKKRNTFEYILMRWTKLESIIQNEISQKEKYNYNILTHTYGILNDGDGLVAKSCPTLATPWTVACKVPLSMEFSGQEYWRVGSCSLLQGIFLTQE